jgi:glycosyltransferase involved in cell wall biosynthesis
MPEAFDWFTKEWLKDKNDRLWIIGRFSPELVTAGFDFFRGEHFRYYGVQDKEFKVAKFMQEADILLYPSYSDACPNTVIEAVACGMDVWHNGHAGVGEAASVEDPSLKRMADEYYKLFKSL